MVLVHPRNPLNIGAAARAMANFGFEQLRLVEPYRVASDEARSAVHAEELLLAAREFATVGEAVADCHVVCGTTALGPRELNVPLYDLEEAAIRIRKARGRVAILFGSEKFGLSNDDMSHCHWLVRIPAIPAHRSMNLGQAVAVTLYSVSRRREHAVVEASSKADAGSNERIVQLLLEALGESGYLKPPSDASQTLKTRRLIQRMGLSAKDAEVVQGMLRQVLWKLHKM